MMIKYKGFQNSNKCFPNNNTKKAQALTELLMQCNNYDGWTLLVPNEGFPNKTLLTDAQVDLNKLLVYPLRYIKDLNSLINIVKYNNNYSTLIIQNNAGEYVTVKHSESRRNTLFNLSKDNNANLH